MVNRKTILSLLLIGLTTVCFSQKNVFSEIEIKKSSAYVGEPIEVIVSAYTSTWFTKGVDLGNIKINGAFTVYFRSVSNSMKIDGQTYAGVRLYYHVFPYDDDDIEFPALEIKVETPDLGDFKGKKRTIKTLPRTIRIKPTPDAINADEWLVTSNLSVKENWSTNIRRVKVGDVLERSINRVAANTISELIPPVKWDSIANISLYPSRPTVENIKTKTAINGTRKDGIRYLLEKEGEIEIPEVVFTWWNPTDKQLYKRTLPSVKLNVLPNPDLGILATLQDSLSNQAIVDQALEVSEEDGFWGFNWWQLSGVILLAILILYVLFRGFNALNHYFKIRAIEYRLSEQYFFNLFLVAVSRNDSHQIIESLYRWLDEIELEEPTIAYFANSYGSAKLIKDVRTMETDNDQFKVDVKHWKLARQDYLNSSTNTIRAEENWINP